MRLRAQGRKVLLRPQHGIDAFIVRSVIPVIGAGHEDGVQVDDPDAQRVKIRQFFADTRQISAVKIGTPVAPGVRRVLRRIRQVFMDPEGFEFLRQIAAPGLMEAIRKDLVDHRALCVGGHRKIRRNAADLPLLPRLHIGLAALPEQAEAACGLVYAEPVKIQSAFRQGEAAAPGIINAVAALLRKGEAPVWFFLAGFRHQGDGHRPAGGGNFDMQNTGFPRSERSERGFVFVLPAVK